MKIVKENVLNKIKEELSSMIIGEIWEEKDLTYYDHEGTPDNLNGIIKEASEYIDEAKL